MAVATRPVRERSVLARHHPVGVSTGFMNELRGDWGGQVSQAWAASPFAVELSALSEVELAPLLDYLTGRPRLPFRYLSVHGPSKGRELDEAELVAQLCDLAEWCDGIVMHPDTMVDVDRYLALGRTLLIENMDARKESGRTPDELAPLFAELPEAGFCFDIAHAWSIDRGMSVADELLDAFRGRLRHIHLSSLSEYLHHVGLTQEHEELFGPTLERCVDVPWILEAPPRAVH